MALAVGDYIAISQVCLQLVNEVVKRVENVRVNKKSAEVLRDRVAVVGEVLKREMRNKSEMQVSALTSLRSALESARQLVEDCEKREGFLMKLVNSQQVVEKFSAVFHAIDQAVLDLNLSLGVDIYEGLQDALEKDVKQLSEIRDIMKNVDVQLREARQEIRELLEDLKKPKQQSTRRELWLVKKADVEPGKERIGGGSFGTVVKGRYRKSVHVAIKYIDVASDDDDLLTFKHEVSIMSRLHYPRVVQLIGAWYPDANFMRNLMKSRGERDTVPFIVMEYVDGINLQQMMKPELLSRLLPSAAQRLKILRDVAEALNFMHALNIVHKDLKPANVLVERKEMRAKVTDFGLSSNLYASHEVRASKGGTALYMAPEFARNGESSKAMDVWSFGVMAWELFSEKRPYKDIAKAPCQIMYLVADGSATLSMTDVKRGCPEKAKNLIAMCLQRQRDRRPSFSEIYNLLDQILSELSGDGPQNPVGARSPGKDPKEVSPPTKRAPQENQRNRGGGQERYPFPVETEPLSSSDSGSSRQTPPFVEAKGPPTPTLPTPVSGPSPGPLPPPTTPPGPPKMEHSGPLNSPQPTPSKHPVHIRSASQKDDCPVQRKPSEPLPRRTPSATGGTTGVERPTTAGSPANGSGSPPSVPRRRTTPRSPSKPGRNQSFPPGPSPQVFTDPQLRALHQRGVNGDVFAQMELGYRFDFGEGVPKNAMEALRWYLWALERAEARAGHRITKCLKRSGDEALRLQVDKAARYYYYSYEDDSSDPRRAAVLSIVYYYGIGIDACKRQAYKLVMRARDENHSLAEAKTLLGLYCQQSRGHLPKDAPESIDLYLRAAERGHSSAHCYVGDHYKLGSSTDGGQRALISYRKGAAAGDPAAQYQTGVCLMQGLGGRSDRAEAVAEAVSWYQKAATQGHADAQLALCRALLDRRTTSREQAEAMAWCARSAEQRNAAAQFFLYECFRDGAYGLCRDFMQARQHLGRAARYGHTGAAAHLGSKGRQASAA